MLRASSVVVLGLIVVASCFGGPPNAPVSGTLGPGPHGAAPRASAGFAVAFAGPRGVVTDLTQPAVTVLFDHAAHDPDAADTEALPAVSVATEQGQAVAGAWQWVGSHGLIFTPDHTLPGSTRFVVTIAAGAKALDGDALGTDYRFEFTTARPAVEGTAPDDGATDLRPDSVVRIQFNQPMDPGEVERAVHAVARDRSGAEQPVAFHASRATSGPAAERTVLLTPAAPLPLDRAIDVALPRGLRGQGPLATTSAHELSFRTYGPLRLADVRCPRATGPRCQAHRDFTIVLSNAVAPAEFKAHFKAPDLPLQKPDAEEETKESKKEARKLGPPGPSSKQHVAADPDFGKRYHLRITAGMRDVFGQVLDHDLVADVDTEAPFIAGGKVVDGGAPASAPASAPQEDDSSGSSPAPEPQAPSAADPRPHRARLDYDLAIGLQGHVIEALAKQGLKSHRDPHRRDEHPELRDDRREAPGGRGALVARIARRARRARTRPRGPGRG